MASNELRYTLAGYLTVLTFRTGATLLVEGPRDRDAVCRLVIEVVGATDGSRPKLIIDTAEMVVSVPNTYSNREKVEFVYNETKASGRIGALVDREFRGFATMPEIKDTLGGHFVHELGCFWTRGHSMENYLVSAQLAVRFVTLFHPEYIPHSLSERIQAAMPDIYRGAAAFSLAAFDESLLGRCGGMWTSDHWKVDATGIYFPELQEIAESLGARGVTPVQIQNLTNRIIARRVETSQLDMDLCRWLMHGHIGFQMFWACIGRILVDCGVDVAFAHNLATGFDDQKRRLGAEHWAQVCNSGCINRPIEFIRWIREKAA